MKKKFNWQNIVFICFFLLVSVGIIIIIFAAYNCINWQILTTKKHCDDIVSHIGF